MSGNTNKYMEIIREHKRAQQHTRWLVRSGQIKPDDKCALCGSTVNMEPHHIDYDLPDLIVWLCRKCHRKEDGWRRKKLHRYFNYLKWK